MDIIIENCLFLGNYSFASSLENLKKFAITHIIVSKFNFYNH